MTESTSFTNIGQRPRDLTIRAAVLLCITAAMALTTTQGKNRQILSPRPSVAMRSLTKQNKQHVRGSNLRAVVHNEDQRDLTVLIDLSNLKKDKSMEEEPPEAAQENKEKEVLLEEEVDLLKQEVTALEDELVAMESLGSNGNNKKVKTDKQNESDEIVNDEDDEQQEQDDKEEEEEEEEETATTNILALDGTQHDSSTTTTSSGVVKYCGLQKLDGTIECSVHPKLIRCESYVDCEPLEQDGDFFYRECLEECNVSDIDQSHAEQALKDFEQRKQILASKEQDEDGDVELQNEEATLEAALKELANQEHSEEHVFDEQVDNALLSQGGVDVGVTFEVKYCGTRDSITSGGDFECDSQAVLCRSDADCETPDANPKYNKCLASCKGIVDQQASNLSVTASDTSTSSSLEEDEDEDGDEDTNGGQGKGNGKGKGQGQGQGQENGQGQAQGQGDLKKTTTEKTKEQLEVMAQDLTSTTNEKLQKDDPLYEHTQKASDSSTGYCGLQVIEGATPECDNQVIPCDTDNDCSSASTYTKCLSECKMILFEGLTYDEHQQLMEETATGGLVIPTDPLVEYFEPGSEINQQVQQSAASEGSSSNTYVFKTVRKYCGIQGDTPQEFHCQTGPFKPCQTNDDCRSTSTRRTKRRRKGLRFLQEEEEGSDANESNEDNEGENNSDQTDFELLSEEETNIYTDCLIECGEVAAMEDPTSALLDIPTVMVDVTTQEGYNG